MLDSSPAFEIIGSDEKWDFYFDKTTNKIEVCKAGHEGTLACGDFDGFNTNLDAAMNEIFMVIYSKWFLKSWEVKCLKCGMTIPAGRIQAVPDTRWCVGCVGEQPVRDPNILCDKSSESARNGWGKSD